MEISIIGLPKSGKTTIFNALTRCTADIKPYASSGLSTNLSVAKVPDARLDGLSRIYKPKKTTPAEVKYVDIAGLTKGFGKEQGISGQLLNFLSTSDAILLVVRTFENANLPHIGGSIDPRRDIETLDMELIFSDLAIVEKRLSRIESSLKMGKSAERDAAIKEQALLLKVKDNLEKGIPIRLQNLTVEELHSLSNYQFLTAKPMLIVINIGEQQLAEAERIQAEMAKAYSQPQVEIVSMCGELEMELSQLGEAEAEEFRKDMGIKEAAFDVVIKHSYSLLGLISFFTVGDDEVKAWTIQKNTPAIKAAGKIHTDIERGFIRAEVISYNDFIKFGSLPEARKHGSLRLEGKNYIIQDGDISHFLFNV
ncbi:MAG: redox-regulated ATPase YchF [Dehalococcoidia bacterium]|nr:redox-regulated ATPase YchF [Dehalococcoidia bacterium]